MIEHGGGAARYISQTNWHLHDLPTMWTMLQDQETTNHSRQVSGWRRTCELALTHLSRLQEYRRGLAAAWPPDRNTASRAYLERLDSLIENIQRTHDAAVANHTALAAVTSAIAGSRRDLKKLYDEYAAKRQQKQEYDALVADPKAALGSRTRNTTPPVTDGELEALNVRARGIMAGLGLELQQAQAMIRQPPPKPNPGRGATELPDSYGGSAPPVIPPIVPVPLTTGQAVSPPAPSAVQPVPTPTAPGTGPVLGGVAPTAPVPVNPALPTVTTPTQSTGIGGTLPSVLPPGTPPRSLPSTLPSSGGTGNRPSPPGTPPRAMPMPPGGLIGGLPGAGLGQPGAAPARRANPVGGVIGGGGAGTAPAGGAGSRPSSGRGLSAAGYGMPPFGGAPGRRRDPEQDERRWDPDNPWETERGVPPVVRPPDGDDRIDPGPAIGFDR